MRPGPSFSRKGEKGSYTVAVSENEDAADPEISGA
jgi:hypothetical protein